MEVDLVSVVRCVRAFMMSVSGFDAPEVRLVEVTAVSVNTLMLNARLQRFL